MTKTYNKVRTTYNPASPKIQKAQNNSYSLHKSYNTRSVRRDSYYSEGPSIYAINNFSFQDRNIVDRFVVLIFQNIYQKETAFSTQNHATHAFIKHVLYSIKFMLKV